jgi:hypothetical protein
MTIHLKDIDQVRGVGNWAVTYLWDIRFLNSPFSSDPLLPKGGGACPYPFDKWFPASSVDEPVYNIETHNVNHHVIQTEIPKAAGLRQISVEFYDDYNHTLETWLRYWYDSMFPDHLEVTPLMDVVKILEVARLSPQKEVMHTNRYYVFPKGNLNVSQNSNSTAKKLSITLSVAGHEIIGAQSRFPATTR